MVRWVAGGVLAAVGLVALVLGGAFLMGQGGSSPAVGLDSKPVVVVFASADQDGVVVAQAIEVVTSTRSTGVSPDTTVTIPGTAYSHLRDAHTFGGGRLVAEVMATENGMAYSYIDVPEEAWRDAVDRAGGLELEVEQEVNVFDGQSLTTIPAGTRLLSGAEIAALLKALRFLPHATADGLRAKIGDGLLEALEVSGPAQLGLSTDMHPEVLVQWWKSVPSAKDSR